MLLLAGSLGGASLAGCAGASPKRTPAGSEVPTATARPEPAPTRNVDTALRARAIGDEQSLLAACAAPKGQEPFETLTALHLARLRVLTGSPAARPAARTQVPVTAVLITAERRAVAARRADCVRASADLAPLLASLAAGGNVALTLLAQLPATP